MGSSKVKAPEHPDERWLFLPRPIFKLVTGRTRDVLFLWVPKCAGTSVYTALVKYGCIQKRWEKPLQPFSNRGISTFGHVDVLQLIEQGVMTRRYFDQAFKFAFVRNPYDRLVSLFFYLKKIKCEEVPEQMSFGQFCGEVDRGEYPPVGLYNYQGLNQCNPMASWLIGRDGRLLADFVGRHENVRADFRKVGAMIGIDEEIPHENRTERKPYQDYYTAETRAIVERVYREDFERFDYRFESS